MKEGIFFSFLKAGIFPTALVPDLELPVSPRLQIKQINLQSPWLGFDLETRKEKMPFPIHSGFSRS
jgi:hypothetical protein